MANPSALRAPKKRPANVKKPVLTTDECEKIAAALEGGSGGSGGRAANRRLRLLVWHRRTLCEY